MPGPAPPAIPDLPPGFPVEPPDGTTLLQFRVAGAAGSRPPFVAYARAVPAAGEIITVGGEAFEVLPPDPPASAAYQVRSNVGPEYAILVPVVRLGPYPGPL